MRRHSLPAIGAVILLMTTTACGGDYAADGGGPVFQDYGVNPEVDTTGDYRSTFALDVDTGSYTVTRGYLADGLLPDPSSVRTEEFVNYFSQDYRPPPEGLGIHLDATTTPFDRNPNTWVMRVGIQAAVVDDPDRPPANLTFIVDASGSMAGRNLEMVTAGLERLVDSLRPDDRVAIVTFSDDARLLLPMTTMTEPEPIRAAISALRPQRSTNVEAGLRTGYAHARERLRRDGLNRVILLSDGEANVGETDPEALAAQIAREAGRETQLAVIGVGRQTYNEVILEQFANNGNGFYAYLDTAQEAERLFVHDLTGTLQAVAMDAKVQVRFNPDAVASFRLLGYENRSLDHDDLRDDTVDGGEVGAGHAATALYEVTLPAGADLHRQAGLATVDVRWIDPSHREPVERRATLTAGDLTPSFDEAPVRLRQDVLVAAFAECLRGGPWSHQVSLPRLADEVSALSRWLPQDQRVSEFAELVDTAARLAHPAG